MRPLAADPFFHRTKNVAQIAPNLPLVGQPREPTSSWKYRQQGHFRKRNRRRAILDKHDVITSKRELITAAGASAAHGGDIFLTRVGLGRLHGIACFISKFTEVNFMGMSSASQHTNVRASAKYPILARLQHYDTHLGMLKPHPLNDVRKFDIDAEIVGVQLQFVPVE